ncbi:MAG: methyltransferase domain-containing protein [Candidatus Omnitrophica bacterium]|nr:methyltransferase domain-containing protein [Candidatus Omnitrophota bacterium]
MDQVKVKEYWESLGVQKLTGELVTHRDINQVHMEIDQVLSLLSQEDSLLDIGCGNGYSTSVYAKKCKRVMGIDYAQNMIESATRNYRAENISFRELNVLNLNKSIGLFNVILTTRCLINLDSWEKQEEALKAIQSCLEPGGRFIMIEGSQQGRNELNQLRQANGLSVMPPVWHNIDFDEVRLKNLMVKYFDIEYDIRFGLYDVLTRVQYPSLISPKEPEYGTDFHHQARKLSRHIKDDGLGRYSREFVMVFRKK